jgi:hypothetical protein
MKESGSDGERCWPQASLGSEAEHGRRPNVPFDSPVICGQDRAKPPLEMTWPLAKLSTHKKSNRPRPPVLV